MGFEFMWKYICLENLMKWKKEIVINGGYFIL